MGLFDFLASLFGKSSSGDSIGRKGKGIPLPQSRQPNRWNKETLAVRLGLDITSLESTPVSYHQFSVPKRKGGMRELSAPIDPLKHVQRRILHRLLAKLEVHPAAKGFCKGQSIVSNALPHVGKRVVMRMDLRDFFPNTRSERVQAYFQMLGWDEESASLLTTLCTHNGGLPQGAPTSPCLSNLVNLPMDARLSALANKIGATYTRYADDMTFSFAEDDRYKINSAILSTKKIVSKYGYYLHQDKKLRIYRQHNRQMVTGLVVNQHVNLPRSIRRKLRAMEHRIKNGQPATLSAEQLTGWYALQEMVITQSIEGRQADQTPPDSSSW